MKNGNVEKKNIGVLKAKISKFWDDKRFLTTQILRVPRVYEKFLRTLADPTVAPYP